MPVSLLWLTCGLTVTLTLAGVKDGWLVTFCWRSMCGSRSWCVPREAMGLGAAMVMPVAWDACCFMIWVA